MNLDFLLKLTAERNASDLHLCVGIPPMLRVNEKLEKATDKALTNEDVVEMLSCSHFEKKVDLTTALNGIDVSLDLPNVARFRVNIYRDHHGLCVAFRLIPTAIKSPQELGLPDVVEQIYQMNRGLVVVTGVTGSGKSTTLASIINKINSTKSDHIITIEDPIEFLFDHKKSIVNQREIGLHVSSFSDALRSALREDPDIIMVGELRDLFTISMAITAAETGHLVLTTLHTRGAPQTVDRIIDVFPPDQQEQIRVQLADVLEMVISQVLIPSPDYKQRYLASEVMVATQAIRHHIRERKTFQIKSEIEKGKQDGMQTMEGSLKQLVNQDKITYENAIKWVTDKRFFESYFAK